MHDSSVVHLEISAKFMGRTDCPSVSEMEAAVTNSRGRVIHRTSTSQLTAPADVWGKTTIVINPVDGAHGVIMILRGKDANSWQGYYGSKVCNCSVRVLGTEEELQGIILRGRLMIRSKLIIISSSKR